MRRGDQSTHTNTHANINTDTHKHTRKHKHTHTHTHTNTNTHRYTIIDPTSPIFMRGDTIHIPCIFIAWTGN